ncbi:hypothetical protein [Enterobacter asburiae]|uniref:hypothetical protein n=1 Tax=Enterobacter asburiae TaxID=61645 RepID=UPI0007949E3A|nr:hypothetical protein [Enterobacter asburiae]CAE7794732.1 hypothetical protein AI2797V1_2242 [Enterobacter cloacae]UWA77078.1 hypothetical protein M5T12_10435 [Enterobacter asburiae]CAE7809787.1 hypothetical protein AI2802V1_2240 [Enterobacter cloacae]CAH3689347.1 hypothetical protein AI2797V1_2242 [Enterobacter cloacae]CAH3974950.1 hypothetical protein AI2802V1_2240 [Enterobacter cloacae]
MMRKHKLPSAEEIDSLLDYNPETGVFTWKVTKSGWVVKGRPDVKKWSARSTDSSGKRVFLGYYRTIRDAVAVLNDFRREQHGEFAKN